MAVAEPAVVEVAVVDVTGAGAGAIGGGLIGTGVAFALAKKGIGARKRVLEFIVGNVAKAG